MKNAKKISRIIKSIVLSMAVVVMMIPNIKVHAAGAEYTITFSAGSETFADGTKNKKVTCTAGDSLPAIPGYTDLDVPMDKYIVTDASAYKFNASGTVERNEKIVVQYGKLNNGVEYKVTFVDAATGAEIATPVIGRAETGNDSPVISAPTINDYALQDPSVTSYQFVNLRPTGVLTYTFNYNYTGTGGGTTVVTEPGTTTVVTTDGGTETVYQVNEVPTYVSTPVAGGGAGGGGAAEGGAQPAEGDANVQIDEGDVPLAPGIDNEEKTGLENDGKDVILEDEEVPKALLGNGISPTSVLIASGIGLVVIAIVAFGITRFKKSRVAAVSNQKDNKADK